MEKTNNISLQLMGEILRLYIFLTLFLLHVTLVHLRERRWHVRFGRNFL